jgi:outer membrane biosynthesis protein TonB
LLSQKGGFGLVVHAWPFRLFAARCKPLARIALSVILSCTAASAVVAQDAIPETPPELRDFRLDPERTQPAPQPQPEVQPPPVVRTVEPQPLPAEPQPERPAPSQPRQTERQAPAATDTTAATTGPLSEQAPAPVPAIVEQSSDQSAPAFEQSPTPTESSALPWWQILAAVAAAVLALLGGWLYLRRRQADVSQAEDLQSANTSKAAPAPTIIAQPASAKMAGRAAPRPRILLEFVPDKATLGFSALTLKGQLRLVNEGDAPANDMQLRATMISANQRQKETIAAFHSGAITIAPNAIGNAKEGERLALDIEMSVPVNELESYAVGERRIFVPLMLANLEYEWAEGKDSATIACMIGRETEPPQPKMGPLRLDLGPRSFSPLGQRPIHA